MIYRIILAQLIIVKLTCAKRQYVRMMFKMTVIVNTNRAAYTVV